MQGLAAVLLLFFIVTLVAFVVVKIVETRDGGVIGPGAAGLLPGRYLTRGGLPAMRSARWATESANRLDRFQLSSIL